MSKYFKCQRLDRTMVYWELVDGKCFEIRPFDVPAGVALLNSATYPLVFDTRDVLPVALAPDVVNHPPHYTSHPSGVECIQITEHMGFNLGNALKYIWRADLKADAIEDMQKAVFYLNREIELRERNDD